MKIRGIEVDFDFLDADDVERFEKEAKKVQEECEKRRNTKAVTGRSKYEF